MSSNHIVRDGQEPALLVYQLQTGDEEILQQLLEWSPLLICVEGGLQWMIKQGYKIDVAIVLQENQVEWEQKLDSQRPVKILAAKEGEDLHAAFRLLSAGNHKMLNVMSDTLSVQKIYEMKRKCAPQMELVLYRKGQRYLFVEKEKFSKWYPKNFTYGIFPYTADQRFSLEGPEDRMENEILEKETSFHITTEGMVNIRTNLVPLIVCEKVK